MTTVVAAHKADTNKVAQVAEEMRTRGAPIIRAVEVAGVLFAVEGTHRLAAAAQLGIEPEIEVLPDDDAAIVTGLDLEDRESWTVGELRDYLSRGEHGVIYTL